MENKEYWIVLLMATASVGISVGVGAGLAVLVAGAVGVFLYEFIGEFRWKKFVHLDGIYKINVISVVRIGKIIAEVTYRGAGEGRFDIEKIYSIEKPDFDLWKSLTQSEQLGVHDELREHFWKMRGEKPRLSKIH